jgi:hypothetical protein
MIVAKNTLEFRTNDSIRCPEPVSVDGRVLSGFDTRFTGPIITNGDNQFRYDTSKDGSFALVPVYSGSH